VSGSLNVTVALSHPNMPADTEPEEPFHALLTIEPTAVLSSDDRPPLNIVLVVDSSATMHHLLLSDVERDYWMSLAVSRDELERGRADGRDAVYWTGQTLAEMESSARKPMAIAVEAIKSVLSTLKPTDRVSVLAFADKVHTVFSDRDWATLPTQCLMQLDLLRDQRLSVDIGTGTFLADALQQAGDILSQNSLDGGINRLIVVSDGIVQDIDSTLASVAGVQDRGFSITTIGLGLDFDEEFLIRIADNSRGEYHHAPEVAEIIDCLTTEFANLKSTSVTDLYIAVRGLNKCMIQDIFMVRPAINLFDEIYTEDDWMRARIGDVSSNDPSGILVQYIPSKVEEGFQLFAEAQLTWTNPGAPAHLSKGYHKITMAGDFTNNAVALQETNPAVVDLVDRFNVFKLEREAQRAQDKGDLATAKEKYGAATRQLSKLGETELAQDMQAQIFNLGSVSADTTRIKRIKNTTRKLGVSSSSSHTDTASDGEVVQSGAGQAESL